MSEKSHGVLYRVRMRLAWFIAPGYVKWSVRHYLNCIETRAHGLKEDTPYPSQRNEDARGIDRLVDQMRENLCIDAEGDRGE